MVSKIFGKDGLLYSKLGFEYRQQQEEYASFVDEFISSSATVAAIEAPTGVGKTLGYLVPLFMHKVKCVIATGTIVLQDQVVQKELPRLANLGFNNSFMVLKGRSNFICPLRFKIWDEPLWGLTHNNEEVRIKTKELVADGKELGDLERFKGWLLVSTTGDRAELDFKVPFWDQVCAEWDGCGASESCDLSTCPYYRQVIKARGVTCLVVNHAMYFANHQLPEDKRFFYPQFTVFDEAHKLVDSISNAYGGQLSHTGIVRLLERVASYTGKRSPSSLIEESRAVFKRSSYPRRGALGRVKEWFKTSVPDIKVEMQAEKVNMVRQSLLRGLLRSTEAMVERIIDFTEEKDLRCAYYLEEDIVIDGYRLKKSLIDVSEVFQSLSGKKILTSATLAVGGNFKYLSTSLGGEMLTKVLSSPFDFKNNCLLYATPNFPDPNSEEFVGVFASRVEELLSLSKGHAFVLFTSWERLKAIKLNIPYPIMRQGDMSTAQLVQWFRSTPNAVLLGTASFWEGVDVIGDQLRLVIIERVPFPVPTEPLFKARSKVLEAKGKNAFIELALPTALIRLKQGFGRLIRSSTDKGVVAILDRRLAGYKEKGKYSSWATTALSSLPLATRTGSLSTIDSFFKEKF